MYKQFFSLKAFPFSISPDPSFLFLSFRHKEALMHLRHGLKNSEGVLLLTGEVGTGKTLLLRCLLQQLPPTTHISNVLNPTLSDVELLETLCEQFGISYQNSTEASLFLILKNWLIQNHNKTNEAIVIIDEAQHLSLSAIEKLIELTKIEIDKKKLLQIILIGQTELQDKLKEKDFRFLAHKITVRYHLLSLSCLETSKYIQHRLSLVGAASRIFTEKSVNLIHKISSGTPRLINILCDRCLLTAYTTNNKCVTATCVSEVAHELQLTSPNKKNLHSISNIQILVIILLLGFSIFEAVSYFGYNISFLTRFFAQAPPAKIVKSEAKKDLSGFDRYKNIDFSAVSFNDALSDLYAIWGYKINKTENICQQGNSLNLLCYTQLFTFDKLINLNYPVVVKLKIKGSPVFAVLFKIKDNDVQLLIKDQLLTVSISWFNDHWNGDATLLWQAPFVLKDDLRFGQRNNKIAWLAKNLSSTKDDKKSYSSKFDLRLLKEVKAFQRSHNINDNGFVTNDTLMMMMPLVNPNTPRLTIKDH